MAVVPVTRPWVRGSRLRLSRVAANNAGAASGPESSRSDTENPRHSAFSEVGVCLRCTEAEGGWEPGQDEVQGRAGTE